MLIQNVFSSAKPHRIDGTETWAFAREESVFHFPSDLWETQRGWLVKCNLQTSLLELHGNDVEALDCGKIFLMNFFFLSYSKQIHTQTWLAWSKAWVHFPNSSWALDQVLSLQRGTRELFFGIVSVLGSGWCSRGGCAVRRRMSGLHMGSTHTLLQGWGRRAVTTRGNIRNVCFTVE